MLESSDLVGEEKQEENPPRSKVRKIDTLPSYERENNTLSINNCEILQNNCLLIFIIDCLLTTIFFNILILSNSNIH